MQKMSIAYAGKTPWHKTGTVLTGTENARKALEPAGLDWEVALEPNRFMTPEGESRIGHGYQVVRKDTQQGLGTVHSTRYKPVQNTALAESVDRLFSGLAVVETAGYFKNGLDVWFLMRDPRERSILNEAHTRYYLVTNNHGGLRPVRMFTTTVRVVCENTLAHSLSEGKGKGLSLRHSDTSLALLQSPELLLDLIEETDKEFAKMAEIMANRRITSRQRAEYWKTCFGIDPSKDHDSLPKQTKDMFADLETYYSTGPGQASILDTYYGAFQAVTGFNSNVREYRLDADTQRAYDLIEGKSSKINLKALSLATAV